MIFERSVWGLISVGYDSPWYAVPSKLSWITLYLLLSEILNPLLGNFLIIIIHKKVVRIIHRSPAYPKLNFVLLNFCNFYHPPTHFYLKNDGKFTIIIYLRINTTYYITVICWCLFSKNQGILIEFYSMFTNIRRLLC